MNDREKEKVENYPGPEVGVEKALEIGQLSACVTVWCQSLLVSLGNVMVLCIAFALLCSKS